MAQIKVIIKDIENSSFSRACLSELKREGIKEGMIITGEFNPVNKAVDFVSPETGIDCMAWLGITCEKASISKILFDKEAQKRYTDKGLDQIIPLEIALRIKDVIDNEGISEDYIHNFVYRREHYSKRKSYKGVGARIGGAYRFITKNKKAFNGLILSMANGRAKGPYLWSKKIGHIWLSEFEAYCLISEYRNAYFNSMHLCCDGTSNPEPFNKPIRYYQSY